MMMALLRTTLDKIQIQDLLRLQEGIQTLHYTSFDLLNHSYHPEENLCTATPPTRQYGVVEDEHQSALES